MKTLQFAMAAGCAALVMSAWAIGAEPIGINEPGINRAAPAAKPIGVNEPGVNRKAKRKGNNRGYVVGKGGVARVRPGKAESGEAEAASQRDPR